MEEKVKKEHQDYTSDGAIDRHGHRAVREKTGDWVAAILILGITQLQPINLIVYK